MSEPRCDQCRFFGQGVTRAAGHTYSAGECRRHPPTVVRIDGQNLHTAFPVMEKEQWCGEFQRKPLTPEETEALVKDIERSMRENPQPLTIMAHRELDDWLFREALARLQATRAGLDRIIERSQDLNTVALAIETRNLLETLWSLTGPVVPAPRPPI